MALHTAHLLVKSRERVHTELRTTTYVSHTQLFYYVIPTIFVQPLMRYYYMFHCTRPCYILTQTLKGVT
jgi:hypothetical protein